MRIDLGLFIQVFSLALLGGGRLVAGGGSSRERLSSKGIAQRIPDIEFTAQGGGRIPQIGLGTAGTFNSSAILSALKHGYRHIDTALLYGNQYAVNDAIRESGIERENLWVTTKVGFFPKNLMLPIPPLLKELLEDGQGYERRNEKTREDLGVKLSLQQLGLSYADLCLVHSPLSTGIELWGSFYPHWGLGGEDTAERTGWKTWALNIITRYLVPFTSRSGYKYRMAAWKNLERMKEEGLCKYIGVSNYEVAMLKEMDSYAKIEPAVNQLELHPLRQMREVQSYCQEKGIAVIGYGTEMLANHTAIREIAHKHRSTPFQVILRWRIQKGMVSIPRSTHWEHLRENLLVTNSNLLHLDRGDMEVLKALDEGRSFYWQTKNLETGVVKASNSTSKKRHGRQTKHREDEL